MRRGGGKGKGSAFERLVCKRLSMWVSHGEREDLFWRSAMSGGRATVGRRKGVDLAHHAGDISATHPDGHLLTDQWYIECKAYKDLRIESAMIEGKGTLANFWREACEQATAHKRMPLLILKQNNTRMLLVLPRASMLSPYGTDLYPRKHMLAYFARIGADVYDFDGVMTTKFKQRAVYTNFAWLEPGELQRILNPKKKVKREKIKR